ncbi:acetylornithine transaminase [Ascoidea rubescens DSM 1968]|uniref:Acetylornithine aminotransferase, mitochondrial n=1 Tax=Ascoidea rubescens DSM 1968 TaxID=1344418 RepID=A0A1D2VNV0_9ASCO|nr:acetylornithine aminotransferase mitochondrial precursor [Ascoidea rubescens DSM 1968]ODV63276.1 acetylornithine aminotransferase mitochondrial precursor [Ascoidea rubescens DSM 1968]
MFKSTGKKLTISSVNFASKRFLSTSKVLFNFKYPVTHPDPVDQNSKTIKFINENVPFAVTTYSRPSLVFTKGEGSYLWDLEDRKYVDFTAGIAVTALGHANPKIAEILYEQAKTLVHSSNLYHNLYTTKLSKDLVDITKSADGMVDASRVFLCNSGTEANEAAFKFARKYGTTKNPEKYNFITFNSSFHGRSMGALSLTPNPKYQKPYSPLVPGVKVANPNDIESVKQLINENTCGVIIEPIQGEGGVNAMDSDFLVHLKQLCNQNDAILIYDEIQCGLGRTGKLWAHSYLPKEAHPDIITMAKALGNGFPIGATMVSEKVEKVLNVGDHGTTYGGNPLGSRVGLYMIHELSKPLFLKEVSRKSDIFVKKLTRIQKKHPKEILEVRGKGLLLGIELQNSETIGKIIDESRKRGLLIISASGNVIRFVPPLNIDDSVIEEGLTIFEKAVETVLN